MAQHLKINKMKHKKPLRWYYHKIMCEIAWKFRNKFNGYSWKYYYKHLNIMCDKHGFNLYGEPIVGFKKATKQPEPAALYFYHFITRIGRKSLYDGKRYGFKLSHWCAVKCSGFRIKRNMPKFNLWKHSAYYYVIPKIILAFHFTHKFIYDGRRKKFEIQFGVLCWTASINWFYNQDNKEENINQKQQ